MKSKLFLRSSVCAFLFVVAGCVSTTESVDQAAPTETAPEGVTTISQMGELPDGAKTSLVSDPNEIGFLERARGAKKKPLVASLAKTEKASEGPLAFGASAKACGVSKKTMGKKIESFPAKSPRLHLYDSNPKSKAPHDFYITGLKGNCPQKFTAAAAMFGDLELHEILRYELSASAMPYSETDVAYEVLKGRKCNVKKGVACGKKMKSFSKSTALLTLYKSLDGRGAWAEVLLHNGAIYASSVR